MKTIKNFRFVVLSLLLTVQTAKAAVWENTRTWSSDEEVSYSQWVKANWRNDFFTLETLPSGEANPFKGLRLDCADTVYSMRIIYSYVRRLPFAILDPSGGNRLITNQMKRFDRLPSEAEKARAFLTMMFDVVSTHSVPNDTFPIALSQTAVRPGALILTTEVNHHSWTIKDILDIGVPFLIFNSTVGRSSSIILQQRQSWPNGVWVFEGNHTPEGNAGFRDWRPLEYLQQPVWTVPGYSVEQYQIAAGKWSTEGQRRLQNRKEGTSAKLVRLAGAACEDLKQRVSAVQEGVQYLRDSGGACMNFATFDQYSTPSRDHRLFDSLADVRRAFVKASKSGAQKIDATVLKQMLKIFPQPGASAREELNGQDKAPIDANSICVVKYAKGQSIDLAEAKRRMFSGLLSSSPMDDMDYRWGNKVSPSPLARSCQSWELWTPNVNEAN